MYLNQELMLTVAKSLTRWMNSKKNPDEAVWDTLPKEIQAAYLDQAKAAITAVRIFDAKSWEWRQVGDSLYSLEIPEGTLYRAQTGYSLSPITFVPRVA